MIQPMENLRRLLSKLGIVAARKRGNMRITIDGHHIAVCEASFSVSHDVKPISVLGKLEVEEYE